VWNNEGQAPTGRTVLSQIKCPAQFGGNCVFGFWAGFSQAPGNDAAGKC